MLRIKFISLCTGSYNYTHWLPHTSGEISVDFNLKTIFYFFYFELFKFSVTHSCVYSTNPYTHIG